MIVTLAIWVACIPAILALSMTVGWMFVVIKGGIFGYSNWSAKEWDFEMALRGFYGEQARAAAKRKVRWWGYDI